ncbi:MarR family winged helix-turn-helix transcriptional regulator [Maricaulis sp.]|uniref:MarR family winged helix-turn-helix transcriptional regulator n=1 Tax=Maricaulis sp. TaxID=1486257 RepID=UPI0025B8A3B4|nr:MarR family winged helix-turn-helix transcriptional regulator [Maricaulis sp.]
MTQMNTHAFGASAQSESVTERLDPEAVASDAVVGAAVGAGTGFEPIRLNDYWPYQVTVLADRIARLTAAIVKREAGLNLSQWRVLAAIAEAPGRTAAEVVTVTPMDKGIVSRATKALLEAGLLVRRASQADGRVSHLYLTSKGKTVYAGLRQAVEAVPLAANRMMDDGEQGAFCSLVRRLANSVPEEDR